MSFLCPTCAELRIEWLQAIERRQTLEESMADVERIESDRREEKRALMAFIQRQMTCTECSRPER
jgi:hypothetical protein